MMQTKVIIADSSYSSKIEDLRYISYSNSKGFKISDKEELRKFCKWNMKDENGLVLLALNEKGEPISCLRSNIYFNQQELEDNNISFKNNCSDFVTYPVLDMTFAATSPQYFSNGILSVLRYYMYLLHKNCVKSITGVAVKNTSIHKTLENLGYEFREIEIERKESVANDSWMIARLNIVKLENAISYLKAKHAVTINEFPLLIT